MFKPLLLLALFTASTVSLASDVSWWKGNASSSECHEAMVVITGDAAKIVYDHMQNAEISHSHNGLITKNGKDVICSLSDSGDYKCWFSFNAYGNAVAGHDCSAP